MLVQIIKIFPKKWQNSFTKLKKIFIYLKPQKLYISKDIDLDSALFLLSNRIVKLSTDGCGRGHTRCKKAPSVKVIPDKINIFNKK